MDSNEYFDGDYDVLDEKFAILKIVGSGAYSDVGLGVTQNGERVAVKMLNKFDPKALEKEFGILEKLDHVNLVKTFGMRVGTLRYADGDSKEIAYIAMELLEKGELFDFIFHPRSGFSEKFARNVFKQILLGMQSCHESGVAHRDLKTENIMLNSEFICKVADFGLSSMLMGPNSDGKLYTPLGTLNYACPEIHARKPYDGTKADSFSLGVVLFVIVTGKIPFGRAVAYDGYYKWIMQKKYVNYWTIMGNKIVPVTDEFKDLISKMVAHSSDERLSVEEALKHPWFDLETASDEETKQEFARREIQVNFGRKMNNSEANAKTGGYYRSAKEEGFEEQIADLDLVQENYVESGNPYKFKVELDSAEEALGVIYSYAKKNSAEVKIDETHYKLILSWPPAKEEAENIERDNLQLEASVKTDEEGDNILEFTKKCGSKYDFFNEFDSISKAVCQ